MDEYEAGFAVYVADQVVEGRSFSVTHRDAPVHPWVVRFVNNGIEVLTNLQHQYLIQRAEKAGFVKFAHEMDTTVYLKKED